MHYFSYNDYMDYTENGEINETKKVEEKSVKYEVKRDKKIEYHIEHKIINLLKNKFFLKQFMEDFFFLREINNIENIIYLKTTKYDEDSIICKIQDREIFILIKVIDYINTNITFEMFEQSLSIIKKSNEEKKNNSKRRPIVIPIVIYAGIQEWKQKPYNSYNKINFVQCKKNRINFSYNIINIKNLDVDKIKNSKSYILKEFIKIKNKYLQIN